MEENKWDLLDLAIVGGIVYLSANHLDGWGWLIFILFIRHDR